MAELAASIIGIISAGSKVALILSTVASEVGSAGKEAQVVAREIRSFCSILRGITKTVDGLMGNADQMDHCRDVIAEMTDVSREMFIEILNLTEDLQKTAWGGRNVIGDEAPKLNLARRIKWAFNKPKLGFLRSAIEAYKADLSLALGAIQLAQSSGSTLNEKITTPATEAQFQRASKDLDELVSDYRASLQELEAAREALDDDEEEENRPVPESKIAAATTVGQQLLAAIQIVRSEVNSLHAPTSRVNSMVASNIYESVSRSGARLSLLADKHPNAEAPAIQDLRRLSRTLSVQGPPSTQLHGTTSPVATLPTELIGRSESTLGQALQEMDAWPGATRHVMAGASLPLLEQLQAQLATFKLDQKSQEKFLLWFGQLTQDLHLRPPGQTQLQYLADVSQRAKDMLKSVSYLSSNPPDTVIPALTARRRSPSLTQSLNIVKQARPVARFLSPGMPLVLNTQTATNTKKGSEEILKRIGELL